MSEVLWPWSELSTALGLGVVEGPDILGINNDSRSISRGDLFVALSGAPRPEFNVFEDSGRDGHSYVADAVTNGASGVLVHEEVEVAAPHLLVPDTLNAMWRVARYRRGELSCPVIAVTGSSGKTTFKDLLNQILGGFCSSGSFNNHIGVPVSLMRTPRGSSTAIYEIGTNHPGEIDKLTELVKPSIAICLNVQEAHIGNFKSKSELQREKLSIFSGLVPNGVAVVPFDFREPVSSDLDESQRLLTFGTQTAASANYAMLSPYQVHISVDGDSVTSSIPGGGEHRAATLCAIGAVLHALDIPLARLSALGDKLPPGRGTTTKIAKTSLIDDSYNANPSSMKAALTHFAQSEFESKLAILGDMNELGGESDSFHAELAGHMEGIDAVVAVGTKIRPMTEKLPTDQVLAHFDEATEECLAFCAGKVPEFEGVLVKGSNTIFWTNDFCEKLLDKLSEPTGT